MFTSFLPLQAFASFPAPPHSEISRSRRAIAKLVHAITRDIASVPFSSPLRPNHQVLFDVAGALIPLSDVYLQDLEALTGVGDAQADRWGKLARRAVNEAEGKAIDEEKISHADVEEEAIKAGNGIDATKVIEQWRPFWERAQPVVLALGMKLDEEGFGMEDKTSQRPDDDEK